jgi:hypothetical protein
MAQSFLRFSSYMCVWCRFVVTGTAPFYLDIVWTGIDSPIN